MKQLDADPKQLIDDLASGDSGLEKIRAPLESARAAAWDETVATAETKIIAILEARESAEDIYQAMVFLAGLARQSRKQLKSSERHRRAVLKGKMVRSGHSAEFAQALVSRIDDLSDKNGWTVGDLASNLEAFNKTMPARWVRTIAGALDMAGDDNKSDEAA